MAAWTGGPEYLPTSIGAGVGGNPHMHTYYRGPGGVVPHPLQRMGAVGLNSHMLGQGSYRFYVIDGTTLGGSLYPAGHTMLTLPPIVPVAGAPGRDPATII